MSDCVLRTKYKEVVFVPECISLPDGTMAVTTDGVRVEVSIIGGYMADEPMIAKDIDDICMRLYNMPWVAVRAAWVSRLGYECDFWRKLRLKKLD